MSRPNPIILGVFLVAVWAVLGGVALAKGGFFLAKHEGDTFHLLQIVLRMVDGEWPHLDFMTPIGVMAFAPIALFVELGAGVGHAIHYAQIFVAFLLLPALFWVGVTRFEGALAYLFGAVVLVLTLALIYGEATRAVSISMHYNRWAWAVSYIAIALAVLPPRELRNEWADGAIIGLCMAFLMLCKVTFFAAFAVPVVVALVLRGAFRSLVAALVAGLVVVLVITVLAGVAFWPAYVGDLLAVAGSDVRPQPGANLRTLMQAPAYLGGNLVLFAGVIFLRQADEQVLGLVLLLLVPGFIYVTYQNFGNDPQWLMLLAILLLVPRPKAELANSWGWNLRGGLVVCSAAAMAFAAPSFLNLAYSPFRHYSLKEANYAPMLTAFPEHADLQAQIARSNRVDGIVALDGAGSGLEDRVQFAERENTHTVWRGETLPECELQSGMVAWFETIVADMEANGFAGGKRVFAADLFSGHWLFGDLKRLIGGAPWYYGALSGFKSADYLLVPLCPVGQAARKEVLEAVDALSVDLTELHRTPLYILYGIAKG